MLDKIAEEGRGEAEYVALNDDGSAAAKRFHERVRAPLLTDVEIDWNGLPVADVYPARFQDLFSAKPVIVYGRYTGAATGTIRLKGKSAGQTVVREIPVTFPETEAAHDTLATLWARSRVDDFTKQDYANQKPEIKDAIKNLGLEFRLLTAFTSFVAVEELITTEGGQPRRIDVPVELPEGMNRETTVGSEGFITERQISNLPVSSRNFSMLTISPGLTVDASDSRVMTTVSGQSKRKREKVKSASSSGSGNGVGIGRGSGNGNGSSIKSASANDEIIQVNQPTSAFIVSANNTNGETTNLPLPPYPPAAKAVRAMGSVNVQVSIDEKGNVTSATAVSGHPLLRAASVAVARQAKFTPTQLNGNTIQSSSTIVYNFGYTEDKSIVATINASKDGTLSLEDQKRFALKAKLAPSIFALIERLKDQKAQPSADEIQFVSNGKAEIRVYLADKTPAAIEELKAAGFEVSLDPTTAKFVIGRITLEKLGVLAELKSVQFIAPQMSAQ